MFVLGPSQPLSAEGKIGNAPNIANGRDEDDERVDDMNSVFQLQTAVSPWLDDTGLADGREALPYMGSHGAEIDFTVLSVLRNNTANILIFS
jgi:hypothetical protein